MSFVVLDALVKVVACTHTHTHVNLHSAVRMMGSRALFGFAKEQLRLMRFQWAPK